MTAQEVQFILHHTELIRPRHFHKQTRNIYVRKPAFLCLYHAVGTYLRCCTHTRVSQITTAFAHKSWVDKTKVHSSSWDIFFISLWLLEKGKCFVNFTEQNICVNDWFSANMMVTMLTGAAVTGFDKKVQNLFCIVIMVSKKLSLSSAYLMSCPCITLGLLRLKRKLITKIQKI